MNLNTIQKMRALFVIFLVEDFSLGDVCLSLFPQKEKRQQNIINITFSVQKGDMGDLILPEL